jgi:hypothetical protein
MATATPRPMVLDGHEVREMTDTELAQHELDKAEAAALVAAQAERDSARNAVLAKLGLSAEEAAALLG